MTTKKTYASRLGILALVLALTSTCLLGGTMAKYATEVTGAGSATVAKWSFEVNGSDSAVGTVDLASTAYDNVAEKRIAPGMAGQFAVEIDAGGSEVAVDYTIAFDRITNLPANLKFYEDPDFKSPITDLTKVGVTGTIELKDIGTKVSKIIYWQWPEGGSSNTTADMAAQGKKATFDIKVTGTQATPTPVTS